MGQAPPDHTAGPRRHQCDPQDNTRYLTPNPQSYPLVPDPAAHLAHGDSSAAQTPPDDAGLHTAVTGDTDTQGSSAQERQESEV